MVRKKTIGSQLGSTWCNSSTVCMCIQEKSKSKRSACISGNTRGKGSSCSWNLFSPLFFSSASFWTLVNHRKPACREFYPRQSVFIEIAEMDFVEGILSTDFYPGPIQKVHHLPGSPFWSWRHRVRCWEASYRTQSARSLEAEAQLRLSFESVISIQTSFLVSQVVAWLHYQLDWFQSSHYYSSFFHHRTNPI